MTYKEYEEQTNAICKASVRYITHAGDSIWDTGVMRCGIDSGWCSGSALLMRLEDNRIALSESEVQEFIMYLTDMITLMQKRDDIARKYDEAREERKAREAAEATEAQVS